MRILVLGKFLYSVVLLATQATATPANQQNIALVSGYFQQPTSQYYHTYYGLSYEYTFKNSRPHIRATYAERPKFDSSGYVDQESTYNLLFGGDFYRGKNTLLRAYVGPGVFQGYIAPSGNRESTESKRSYSLKGIHVAMDALAFYGSAFAGIGHEMFVGYVSNDQLEAYVGWPVLFFNIRMGVLF